LSAASPGAALGLSIAAGVALLAGSWWVLDRSAPDSRRFALSPQACNTECQIRQTDCILECDGNVACERKCTATGKACVERCKHAPDAGAGSGGAGGAAGSGGSAGRRGRR
jgi:hypothetical protein